MAEITITSLADSGAGSLRDAISQANAAGGDFSDTIVFASNLSGGTIRLSAALSIGGAEAVTIRGDIDGDGSADITISGDTNGDGVGQTRLLDVLSGADARLYDLQFTNGFADGSPSGTIANVVEIQSDVDLEWNGVTVSNSRAFGDDAAFSSGQTGDTAAILVNRAGGAAFSNSLFTGNLAVAGDGGNGGATNGPSAGGDAVAGILNLATGAATIGINDVGFDGTATGGTGGNAVPGYNEAGGRGGDAVVGILNFGDIRKFSATPNGYLGISATPSSTLTPGGGGQGEGNGSDGAVGVTISGIRNEGLGAQTGIVIGTSGTQGGDTIQTDFVGASQILIGLNGDDSLSSQGDDILVGGQGDDTLVANAGDDTLNGGNGDDLFQGLSGGNEIDGGDGANDTVQFTAARSVFTVVENGEEITITGVGGVNKITNVETFVFTDQTLSKADLIAPPVDPVIPPSPTAGDDILRGTALNDTISALGGDDTVNGLAGDDLLLGGAGGDNIKGNGGDDRIRGNGGDDTLKGNGGADNIKGNGGADNIKGNGGGDVIKAGGGADTVKAGGGSDTIDGGGGADLLEGGGGADVITGKGGNDTLTGNGGADVFQFRASDRNDTISDFRQGQDRIEILTGANAFAGLSIEQDGADVLIGFGVGQVRVVTDNAGAFSEDDFIF